MTVAQVEEEAAERRYGPPAGRRPMPQARRALVVGAGLAGAAAARALALQGLQVTVLEAGSDVAGAASGNPAGLFHGVVHAHDGAHAQLLRAAALRAEQVYRPLVESGVVTGEVAGLLRGAGGEPVTALQAMADAQRIPPAYAAALPREAAMALARCAVAGAAWHFAGGGWLQPATLVRHWLREPGIQLQVTAKVAGLQRLPSGLWRALGVDGAPLGEAEVLVVAAAGLTPALIDGHCGATAWPWRRTRGQITLVSAEAAAALPRPALPIASGGYLIALPHALGGGVLCGATSQVDDDTTGVRQSDHRANLAQLATLTGQRIEIPDHWLADGSPALRGRVAWRLGCDDRLPVVGAVPLPPTALQGARRLEQARHVPRTPGLYVLSALGSRGLTWAPLLGEVLAAAITGAPSPLPGSLMDAIDPARFVSRGARRA